MTPAFITVNTVAAALAISPRQVHRMLDYGELPSVYVGRLRRIPATAFERYLVALDQQAEADRRGRIGDARICSQADWAARDQLVRRADCPRT
jgi:excisionase family DNA binding protein